MFYAASASSPGGGRDSFWGDDWHEEGPCSLGISRNRLEANLGGSYFTYGALLLSLPSGRTGCPSKGDFCNEAHFIGVGPRG